jgi:hypothetical protein
MVRNLSRQQTVRSSQKPTGTPSSEMLAEFVVTTGEVEREQGVRAARDYGWLGCGPAEKIRSPIYRRRFNFRLITTE